MKHIEALRYHYSAFVSEVYDGDTITCMIDLGFGVFLHDQKIRLIGIDAPEVRGKEKLEGIKTRDWLRNKIKGRNVILNTEIAKGKKGKYGRWLATVYDGGININMRMVELGLAEKAEY